MQTTKKLLVFLSLFGGLTLVTALLLPTKTIVKEKITINASADKVFNLINEIKNWEKWSICKKQNSSLQFRFNKIEKGRGAAYEVFIEGKRKSKVVLIKSNLRKVLFQVTRDGEEPFYGAFKFHFTSQENKVELEQIINLIDPALSGRLGNLFTKFFLGSKMADGLELLKAEAENYKKEN